MGIPFLKTKFDTTSNNNSVRNEENWDRHILPYLKKKVVSEITNEDCEKFAKQLTKDRGISMCREVFVVLRTYFNWDIDNQKCLLSMPISQGLRKWINDNCKKAKQKKGKIKMLGTDMQKIFAKAKGRKEEIVYQWLSYNLRIGEALGVRVKDVDLAKGKLFVNNQIQTTPKKINGSYTYQTEILKTEQSHREIDLNFFSSTSNLSNIKQLLTELIKNKKPDDLLFTTRNGTPCSDNNFRRRHFNPLRKKLGLENSQITPQVFRQYFFVKGVKVRKLDSVLLSRAMGHTTVNTSMKYYFPDLEEDDEPLEKKVIKKSKSFKSVITEPNKSEVSNLDQLITFLA